MDILDQVDLQSGVAINESLHILPKSGMMEICGGSWEKVIEEKHWCVSVESKEMGGMMQ